MRGQGQGGGEARALRVGMDMIAFGGAGDCPGDAVSGFAPRPADDMASENRIAKEVEIVTVAGAANAELEIASFRRHIVRRPAPHWLACAVRQVDRAGPGPLAHQSLERSAGVLRITVARAKKPERQDEDHAPRQTSDPLRSSWHDRTHGPRNIGTRKLLIEQPVHVWHFIARPAMPPVFASFLPYCKLEQNLIASRRHDGDGPR